MLSQAANLLLLPPPVPNVASLPSTPYMLRNNKRTEVRAFACLAGSREQCRPCMSHTAEDKCSSRFRKNARAKNIYSALGSTTQAKNSSPVKCQRTEVSQVSQPPVQSDHRYIMSNGSTLCPPVHWNVPVDIMYRFYNNIKTAWCASVCDNGIYL